MNNTRYSLSSDSSRWCWPFAVAGTAALAAIVAIPAAGAGRTSQVATSGDSGEPTAVIARSADMDRREGGCPPPPDIRYVGVPWVPVVPTGCKSLDRWWTLVDREGACPPPPDIRYVGVPWVPAEPTGCKSLDRWWTLVDDPALPGGLTR